MILIEKAIECIEGLETLARNYGMDEKELTKWKERILLEIKKDPKLAQQLVNVSTGTLMC